MLAPSSSAADRLTGHRGLAVWGGAECTVCRVGEVYRDQLEETGHASRPGDFALIASLGLDAVRFPILWERVAPHGAPDWRWSDLGLRALREAGIDVIAGLVHHGSGPRHTSLLDPGFAEDLAGYAARVVERYPWIGDWTPVNEPLTTARFSALYGLWYPHAHDEHAFWRALLNQVDAIRLSMRAIRKVRPDARLIQTEDLGRTYATPMAADQAAFDNQRRWMTWDLLCGLVTPDHPLWDRLATQGLAERLETIADDPCRPDVLGINHYLTSDRFLDERTRLYPSALRGGNGRLAFCDLEAVRMVEPAPQGLRGAIAQTWARYGLPIALTEVHNGCTREEQIRWLDEAWAAASDARANGVDVRAVTVWSLFGSRGWDTLLTAPGTYESGAFDVRSGAPRETALAAAVRSCPTGERGGTGWWRRPSRLSLTHLRRPATIEQLRADVCDRAEPVVLIVGATGTLGQALASECLRRDLPHFLSGRETLDLLDSSSIVQALEAHRPWAVLNAAGWVRVDEAQVAAPDCHAANADGAFALANACAQRGIPCVSFSSDLVFDGAARDPYCESASASPLSVYGASKAELERRVADLSPAQLVVRTAAFFSPHDPYNFAAQCVDALRRGESFEAVADCVVSPTYVPDLCRAVVDLLIDGETGIWHLANHGALSWCEFARKLADATGLPAERVIPVTSASRRWAAKRPAYSALATQRGQLLPSLESAIERFAAENIRAPAIAHPEQKRSLQPC